MANHLHRAKRYEDAIGIYEVLVEGEPAFAHYALNEENSRAALRQRGDSELANGEKFHVPKAAPHQKRLRVADVLSSLNDPALVDLAFGDTPLPTDGQHLLAKANASIKRNYGKWTRYLNEFLGVHGMPGVEVLPRETWVKPHVYLNLRSASQNPRVDGPLVTICIACYNAELYVEESVRSILNQTYENLEIFLINDCSTDRTLEILTSLSKQDRRIRVLDNATNSGTYFSRNTAFSAAKGEYFTVLDADDHALPSRIAIQVDHLEKNPDHIGVLTEWVRMDLDGHFHFRRAWGGTYQHEAVATLMIRTETARNKVGYWDSVRFAADTEYLFRLRKIFGKENLPTLRKPTVLALWHEASLTNHPVNGIKNTGGPQGLSPARLKYRLAWEQWHKTSKGNLFIPFPPSERKFICPSEMHV